MLLEPERLHEIGRLRVPAAPITEQLRDRLAIPVATDDFAEVARAALALALTRDPFDRLVVAHAALRAGTLFTLDARIRANYAATAG